MNHVEIPFANLVSHGDVRVCTPEQIRTFCAAAGLEVPALEKQPIFRLISWR